MKGTELKDLRKALGLSLAEAARQVEVSPRTWARWEADTRSAPAGAVKLFKMLNKVKD
jgi:transcriptional regulator with XRE-family HTH domain